MSNNALAKNENKLEKNQLLTRRKTETVNYLQEENERLTKENQLLKDLVTRLNLENARFGQENLQLKLQNQELTQENTTLKHYVSCISNVTDSVKYLMQ